MQENLKKESKEEDKGENIDFNYKLFLSKGLVTNTMKTDPYLDYKEFFQMQKEKQISEASFLSPRPENGPFPYICFALPYHSKISAFGSMSFSSTIVFVFPWHTTS